MCRSTRVIAASLLALASLTGCVKSLPYHVESEYGVDDPRFIQTMGNLFGPSMIRGNRVTTLVNGDEIFPSMLDAIRSAQHTITFETYVYWGGTVGDAFTRALIDRAKAGVKVHVIVDAIGSAKADKSDFVELRQAGVEVYEYQPTMIHVKLMIVDDLWVSIGSANFDNRSFRLNDEANMNVLDPVFAAQQSRLFEEDLAHCKRITHEQWRKRSPLKKLLDGISTLLSPQL